MKRILAILLATGMVISMSACKSEKSTTSESQSEISADISSTVQINSNISTVETENTNASVIGYETAIENLEKMANGNAEMILKICPEEYWEERAAEWESDVQDLIDEDIADLKEDYEDDLENFEEEYGNNINFSYKIIDEKEISDSKTENIAKVLNERYGIKENSVSKAYELKIQLTIKGDKSAESAETNIAVVEIDGSWYPMFYEDDEEDGVYIETIQYFLY